MEATSTLGELIDVTASCLVVIHDTLEYYGPGAPIRAAYELRRDAAGGLAGEARFSRAGVTHATLRIALDARVTSRFLRALSRAHAHLGPYELDPGWDDHNGRIAVALHVDPPARGAPSGIALLFSSAQTRYLAPWCVFVHGATWVVPDEEIGRALSALRKPIERAVHAAGLAEHAPRDTVVSADDARVPPTSCCPTKTGSPFPRCPAPRQTRRSARRHRRAPATIAPRVESSAPTPVLRTPGTSSHGADTPAKELSLLHVR